MSDAHHERPSAPAAVVRQAGPSPLQRHLPIVQWLPNYEPKWLAATSRPWLLFTPSLPHV